MAAALGGSLLRCDKLEQFEVKSMLMCFLHVLKSMSEGKKKKKKCTYTHYFKFADVKCFDTLCIEPRSTFQCTQLLSLLT